MTTTVERTIRIKVIVDRGKKWQAEQVMDDLLDDLDPHWVIASVGKVRVSYVEVPDD